MIVQENVVIGKTTLLHTFSDAGLPVMQHPTEVLYDEAYDVPDTSYTYTESTYPESEEPIEDDEAEVEDYKKALGRFGVEL